MNQPTSSMMMTDCCDNSTTEDDIQQPPMGLLDPMDVDNDNLLELSSTIMMEDRMTDTNSPSTPLWTKQVSDLTTATSTTMSSSSSSMITSLVESSSQTTMSMSMSMFIPIELIVEYVVPFLDRTTYNNVSSTCKTTYTKLMTPSQQSPSSSLSSSPNVLMTPPWPTKLKSRDHMCRIRCFVFSSSNDGGTNLACGCTDGMIRTWNVYSGERQHPLEDWPGQAVVALAFSPPPPTSQQQQPRLLASASNGHTIKLWNINHWYNIDDSSSEQRSSSTTIQQPPPRNIHAGHVSCLSFSNDGTQLFSGHHHGGEVIRVWNVLEPKVGSPVMELRGGTNDPVSTIRPSYDGNYIIATCAGISLKVWNLSTGTCQRQWNGRGKSYKAVHQHRTIGHYDGNNDDTVTSTLQIASVESEDTISVWSTHTLFATSNHHNTTATHSQTNATMANQPSVVYLDNLCPYEIRFSPNGHKIASVDDFKAIKVWNTTTTTTTRRSTIPPVNKRDTDLPSHNETGSAVVATATTAAIRESNNATSVNSSSSSSSSSLLSSYYEDETLFPIHEIAFANDRTIAAASRYHNAIHLFPA